MGELTSNDVEDGEDGLHQGGRVLSTEAVPQLQLGQMGQSGHWRQEEQVQITVVETKYFLYIDKY